MGWGWSLFGWDYNKTRIMNNVMLGGRGHKKAAGFTVNGKIVEG